MNLYTTSKKLAKKIVPEFLLNSIKRRHYLKVLKQFQLSDEKDLNVVELLVNTNESVIDIGANIGVYVKYLSKFVGPKGNVIAYEPINLTYSFLLNNIKKMKLNNVKSYNVALSDTIGEVEMEIPSVIAGENYFRARIIEPSKSDKKYKVNKVKCETLDNLLEKENIDISFIKCDVEGHELAVLRGGKNTIQNSKCAILIEVNDDPEKDENANEVFEFLRDLNYQPFWYNGNVLKKYHNGDKSVNYFFLLPRHLEKIKQKNLPVI